MGCPRGKGDPELTTALRLPSEVPARRKSHPRTPDHADLAQAIELLIAADAQMSQKTVASESGLSIRQVNAFIRGQGNPTYTTLLALCKGLHVSPGELMTLKDNMRKKRSQR